MSSDVPCRLRGLTSVSPTLRRVDGLGLTLGVTLGIGSVLLLLGIVGFVILLRRVKRAEAIARSHTCPDTTLLSAGTGTMAAVPWSGPATPTTEKRGKVPFQGVGRIEAP